MRFKAFARLPARAGGEARTGAETYLAINGARLGAYMRLRFLMVFAVGAVLSAGFYAIGLDYWLLVGAFVGLMDVVPMIGPLIGFAAL